MSLSDYVLFLLGFMGVYWALWILFTVWLHPYSKYPGPFLASISRLWLVLEVFQGHAHITQKSLHEKLGPIVRIAPNEVSISDPEFIKVIYGVNSGFTKTDFYLSFRPKFARFPDLFTTINEKVHSQRRKIVNNIYSMTSIVKSEDLIDICSELFLQRIGEFAETKNPVDIAKWVNWYTFDVIGELYFSSMFGFMKERQDSHNYIASLDNCLPIVCASGVLPKYIRIPFLFSGLLFSPIRSAMHALSAINQAAETSVTDRIQLREKGNSTREDILDKLLCIYESRGDEQDFTVTDIQVEAYGGFFAGSDTTAAAISSILFHIIKNPVVYSKLMKEIDEASAAGNLSYPHVKYAEAMRLPYLIACCKEGMRIHPSIGMTLPRVVPPGGRQILGQWFPGGLRVGVNAAVVHFDKGIFGGDANEFNPERWLRGDTANMDRHMFQFGSGSRICIGKNISLCEIHKFVPELLRTYEIKLANPDAEFVTVNHWFNKPCPLQVNVKRRAIGV
ncbi:cytochrome P450 [Talaromyces proteolyticus]|uniref:Cytochrome P450 n=1 Tax=Talaromyces proteolyticus TaxID=1131652 RepID=A0AAD4L1R7_9EURO|nr:cytochrome P450 [Talaromyces proteolyticus]KAH8705962.1 cytochrome P450 [Talaromyces proteolyticus]